MAFRPSARQSPSPATSSSRAAAGPAGTRRTRRTTAPRRVRRGRRPEPARPALPRPRRRLRPRVRARQGTASRPFRRRRSSRSGRRRSRAGARAPPRGPELRARAPTRRADRPSPPARHPESSRRGRLLRLQPAQLLDGDVAAHEMTTFDLHERRLLLDADRAEEPRAARVEDAPRWRRGGARDVALEPDPLTAAAVDRRHRGEERLGVRVVRAVEHDVRRPELLDAARGRGRRCDPRCSGRRRGRGR